MPETLRGKRNKAHTGDGRVTLEKEFQRSFEGKEEKGKKRTSII